MYVFRHSLVFKSLLFKQIRLNVVLILKPTLEVRSSTAFVWNVSLFLLFDPFGKKQKTFFLRQGYSTVKELVGTFSLIDWCAVTNVIATRHDLTPLHNFEVLPCVPVFSIKLLSVLSLATVLSTVFRRGRQTQSHHS